MVSRPLALLVLLLQVVTDLFWFHNGLPVAAFRLQWYKTLKSETIIEIINGQHLISDIFHAKYPSLDHLLKLRLFLDKVAFEFKSITLILCWYSWLVSPSLPKKWNPVQERDACLIM